MNKIWNISMLIGKSDVRGYQLEAENATKAAELAKIFYKGTVIRVALAEYDQD
jgi:hypothetical protein